MRRGIRCGSGGEVNASPLEPRLHKKTFEMTTIRPCSTEDVARGGIWARLWELDRVRSGEVVVARADELQDVVANTSRRTRALWHVSRRRAIVEAAVQPALRLLLHLAVIVLALVLALPMLLVAWVVTWLVIDLALTRRAIARVHADRRLLAYVPFYRFFYLVTLDVTKLFASFEERKGNPSCTSTGSRFSPRSSPSPSR